MTYKDCEYKNYCERKDDEICEFFKEVHKNEN